MSESKIRTELMDYSKIKLIPASLKDYPVIQNMGRFYVYDMIGDEDGWQIPEDGLYECIDLKKYWQTDDAFPLLIRYENELAGFVIIDKKGSKTGIDFNVAQFFILRKFKNKGIGCYVAHQCFNKFQGIWEVMVIPGNKGAYNFWKSIIKNYTADNFVEYTRKVAHLSNSEKNIFSFDSSNVEKAQINNSIQSHEQIINALITSHYKQLPQFIRRITIGICNEVYEVGVDDKEVVVRLSPDKKFLMGSHDHIPKFKDLNIKVPDILAEDYSKKLVPFAYQIQNKIEGKDLGYVIESLTDEQLQTLAKEIASIFRKVKTIPASNQFGVVWGGGDNELSETWTERMKIWIDESTERGMKTGVMDGEMLMLAKNLYDKYHSYFDSIKPITYYGDICSKNVMIKDGVFSGLVDLDGLTQGDPLEAIGRIKLSWYGTRYGEIYTNAVMDELGLNDRERKLVLVYSLFNKISWTCENGIQFNQNTTAVVDKEKEKIDKKIIKAIAIELGDEV